MFNCTFQILSQQFGANLIFIESFIDFLFKVYIKQGWFWDTLPTSKMELFVIVGKVIFCRLVIFYTRYYPMSIFSFVSSLLVRLCSRWFHLQASEMVLIVTITIVFCWAMVYTAHTVSSYEFLTFWCQFDAQSISLQMVPGSFGSFQLGPACSRQSHFFSGSSSQFQVVPACSAFQNVRFFSWSFIFRQRCLT